MSLKKYRTMIIETEDGILNQLGWTQEQKTLLAENSVVYIYFNQTAFYVGQTSNFLKRHTKHLKETKTDYRQFSHVIILFGEYVDRNSQLDIERLLITYLITERELRQRKKGGGCLNRQLWQKVPNYITKEEVHSQVLVPFWENELKEIGLVKKFSLERLRESILFKYSPFIELSDEQIRLIEEITDHRKHYIIEAVAGTGKTVVLTNLVAHLCMDKHYKNKKIGVVVKSNWVKQAEWIFKAYGIEENLTIGSAYQLICTKKRYDIIIVDEAHRLQRKNGKQHPTNGKIFDPKDPTKTELDFLGRMTNQLVLLHDEFQNIRPSDIPWHTINQYVKEHNFERRQLHKQFRVTINDPGASYTADDYFAAVCSFLELEDTPYDEALFQNNTSDAYFGLVDSISALFDYIEERKQYHPTTQNRVLAGYARPWRSKLKPDHKNFTPFDWVEGNSHWKWNSTNKNWTSLPGSEQEIGCVHAIQGIDLNYAGVVIAKDLTYLNGKITANVDYYCDKNGIPAKKDYTLEDLTGYIKRIYYVLLTRGIYGIRIYFEDEALRRHFMEKVGLK